MKLETDHVAEFLDGCFGAGIKDPVGYLISKRPQVYDWLKGCFPRGILPTDVDGEVEINGFFLRLEFKHESALRDGRVPKGQRMALMRLIDTKKFTVFIVGTSQCGEPTCVEIFGSKGMSRLKETSRDGIRELCREWADKASKGNL